MEQKRIIIVEDEALIAAEIEGTIKNLGYSVVGKVMNGDKALDKFASTPCDLVLLDINIKGTLSGIDLAKILKEKYNQPFVFITSFADEKTVKEASLTMPYGYIVKPFTEKDLRSNIEMALVRAAADKKVGNGIDFDNVEKKYNINLSQRDRDILLHLNNGKSYKEVGEKLFISINTVKTYQKRLYQSFNVNSKFQLMEKLRL
jgi:DNA-binding NarL/FixJ family response regulator